MTIEEAIEQLGKIELWDIDSGPRGESDRQALKMAIAALKLLEAVMMPLKEVLNND